MIWILLISLTFVSIRDTVSARKRGESVTLAESFRSNFKKLKLRLKQNFQKQKTWLLKRVKQKSYPDRAQERKLVLIQPNKSVRACKQF